MKYTLAIDQSTSATKLMLFDENERLTQRVSLDHRQFYPQPGWVEHDAEEIMDNIWKGIPLLIEKAGIQAGQIASVALTNQRETVVVWNACTGKPVCHAVVWQCLRGADTCRELKEKGYAPMVQAKTGLLIDPYFSATGVKWILDHVPSARQEAEAGQLRMGTMDAWMIWNLTAGRSHVCDRTNASRTMLYNIHTLEWDKELLELLSIPESMVPQVKSCDEIFGMTSLNGLLSEEIPIAGVLGDSHGALVGQMCFSEGMGKATYGTGSSVMVNIGEKPAQAPDGLVTSVGFSAMGKTWYAFEGNIHCTGATVKWMVDDLELLDSSAESEALATSVEDNGGVYFVPAFAGLGAPWWNSEARGLICGMSRGTKKAHVVRAALEAIAYQVKDLVDLMTGQAGITLKELRADGGPARNRFLMQFQSDMLDAPVNVSPIEEASALGAVLMNSLALKRLSGLEEIVALRKGSQLVEPQMDAETRDSLSSAWKKAVARTVLS